MNTPAAKALVFVVEDNDDVRNVITVYLRRNGYAVAEASDGLSAVDRLSRLKPNLVLLDVLLPNLDGIGVLKKLREMPSTTHIPVVMMSAVLQTRDLKNETARLNVSSFVQKPFQMRTVLEHVVRALDIQRKSEHSPPPVTVESNKYQDTMRLKMERTPLAMSGRIEETPVPEVLHSIFVESKTGRLQVCTGTTEKLVFFQNGMPVYAESSIPEETLGAHLLRKGLITKEQHAQALETMTTTGRHFGEILLKLGLIGPHDLFMELEDHLTNKVISVCGWFEGTYKFEEGDDWKDEVIVARMKAGRILLTGVQRYWTPTLVQKRLRITDMSRTFPLNGTPYSEEQLGLSTQEMRVEQLVKRGISVGEIIKHVKDINFAISTLYAFYVMEAAGFILSPAEVSDGKGPDSAAKRPESEKEKYSKILLAEYLKYRTADYFKLLGLSRGASDKEIEYAFNKRKERYHPDTLIGIDTGLVHEKVEELYVRVHDAYKTLMDPILRENYIEGLDGKQQSTPGDLRSKSRRFATMTRKREHDIVFEEGFSCLRGGDFESALAAFSEADNLDPQPKYKAYLAWAAFLNDPQKERKQTEETLLTLFKENDEDALYPYLLGRVCLKIQNIKKAIMLFERALRLDPQHIDSARQLRILRMRSKSTETSGLFDLFKKE